MSTQNPPRLAVAAIVKNEAPYLVEWVAFHRALGIGAFFIADNGSDDGTTELLAEMQDAGLARSFAFPHVPGSPPQLPAYREIMRRHRHEADWFAFIDADEFLFPTDAEYSLSRIMAEIDRHQDIGAVAVNWAIFGSAGHKLPSDELVIERFDKRAAQNFPVNAHCKTILRAAAWAGTGGTPHTFPLAPGFRYSRPKVEDEISSQKEGSVYPISWERLRLNHYVVKSEEEFFRRKLPKGRADAVGRDRTAAFFRGHDRNEVHESMRPWLVSATREAIGSEGMSTSQIDELAPADHPNVPEKNGDATEKVPAIAVITYHRPDYLRRCLGSIINGTKGKYKLIVASDDMRDEETLSVCRDLGVIVVTGENSGVVWNKNRALYYLTSRTLCDPIVLVEDDVEVISEDWLSLWVEAAYRWDHVNCSVPGLIHGGRPPISGDGTPAYPHLHTLVTGQCTAVSRLAITKAGYLDTRFRGYGHGHVEWSKRHARSLFQREMLESTAPAVPFLSIFGGITSDTAPTFRNEDDVKRNGDLLAVLDTQKPEYSSPWKSEEEELRLKLEVSRAAIPVAGSLPQAPSAAPKKLDAKGSIDEVILSGQFLEFRGWAFSSGRIAERVSVRAGEVILPIAKIVRKTRSDVNKAFPEAPANVGFSMMVALADLPAAALEAGSVSVLALFPGSPEGVELHKSKLFSWQPAKFRAELDATSDLLNTPHLGSNALAALKEAMQQARCYLEFGAGGSTVLAARLGVDEIVSVESDRGWISAIQRKLRLEGLRQTRFVEVDIGPTGAWGTPLSDAGWRSYHQYALGPFRGPNKESLAPDLVLIDGRFRVACALATLLCAPAGCRVFFDDYASRPMYKVVERVWQLANMYGETAEFIVPPVFDEREAWLQLIDHVQRIE